MRVALIGCGFFARNHLNAWRDMRKDGIELVAVCDIDPAKAEAAARDFGVPKHYTDAAALFAGEKLDAVDIATRMDTHADMVALALKHGVRPIVQKPFAPEIATCIDMVRSAESAGIAMAVHENFRFQTPMQKVKEVLDSGVIGEVSWARLTFRSGYDVYRTQPYFHIEKRFAILDVGIHILDLARFFLGEVAHLSCETQRRNAKNAGEDTVTTMLRHTSGCVSLVEFTYESRQVPEVFPQTLLAFEGPRGAVKLMEDYRLVVTVDGKTTESSVDASVLPWAERPWHVVQESVLNTQRAIVGAWKAGREAETSGADNLKTFELAEASYLAAETRSVVTIKH